MTSEAVILGSKEQENSRQERVDELRKLSKTWQNLEFEYEALQEDFANHGSSLDEVTAVSDLTSH